MTTRTEPTDGQFTSIVASTFVPDTLEHPTGHTGYLDSAVRPVWPATGGKDEHGRAFLTLCIKVTAYTCACDDCCGVPQLGVVTLFQRYTENDRLVTTGQNHGDVGVIHGGIPSSEELEMVKELLLKGTAVFPCEHWDAARGAFVKAKKQVTLVTPSEVWAAEARLDEACSRLSAAG